MVAQSRPIFVYISNVWQRSLNISKQTQQDCNHNIHYLTKKSRTSHPNYNNVDCAVGQSLLKVVM